MLLNRISQPISYDLDSFATIFVTCVIIFVLITIIKTVFHDHYYNMSNRILAYNKKTQDNQTLFRLDHVVSLFCSMLIFSVFVYEVCYYTKIVNINFSHSTISSLLLILLACTVLFLVKNLINYFVLFIFDREKEGYFCLSFSFTLLEFNGLLIFPFCLFIPFVAQNSTENFVKILLSIVAVIFLLFFFLKIIFFTKKLSEKKNFNYRILLYLCSIEILPYFLILFFVKW